MACEDEVGLSELSRSCRFRLLMVAGASIEAMGWELPLTLARALAFAFAFPLELKPEPKELKELVRERNPPSVLGSGLLKSKAAGRDDEKDEDDDEEEEDDDPEWTEVRTGVVASPMSLSSTSSNMPGPAVTSTGLAQVVEVRMTATFGTYSERASPLI